MDARVALAPTEINIVTNPEGFRELLETKLREVYEGKCNANGYIRPGSLKLLGRSMGAAQSGRFTGNFMVDCKISCEIFYPVAGTELDAMVIKVNKMGAYAVFEEAIRILLPRDTHVGNVAFDEITEGQTVHVRIERSRFQTKDTFVMAVGSLVASNKEEVVAAV